MGHSGPQRFERGALRGCLVSETLRQAEGKPEDPLQALALPACGNPLLLGWEDTEAEGGYQLSKLQVAWPAGTQELAAFGWGHQ